MFMTGVFPGDSISVARAINDSGQVVGNSIHLTQCNRAFLYSDGVMQDLNSLIPADSVGEARSKPLR